MLSWSFGSISCVVDQPFAETTGLLCLLLCLINCTLAGNTFVFYKLTVDDDLMVLKTIRSGQQKTKKRSNTN